VSDFDSMMLNCNLLHILRILVKIHLFLITTVVYLRQIRNIVMCDQVKHLKSIVNIQTEYHYSSSWVLVNLQTCVMLPDESKSDINFTESSASAFVNVVAADTVVIL